MSWHLAQINIGNIIAPQGDPRVQPFFDTHGGIIVSSGHVRRVSVTSIIRCRASLFRHCTRIGHW